MEETCNSTKKLLQFSQIGLLVNSFWRKAKHWIQHGTGLTPYALEWWTFAIYAYKPTACEQFRVQSLIKYLDAQLIYDEFNFH